jgi:phosphatidylinositol-4-phosphate 5-kinase-like protein 1
MHLKEYPQSLLARVYGIYSLKMEGLKSINIILMGNTLRWQNRGDISKIYDLKGSSFNRHVKLTSQIKSTSTLKDLNFLNTSREFQEINLSEHQVRKLNKQIRKDTDMLAKQGIMDYSMLLGIENLYHIEDEEGNVKSVSGRRRSRRSKLSA